MRLFACSLLIGSVVTSAAYTQAIEEVVVTAQRRTENLRDVPLTVTALTSDDLVQSGVTDTRQLQAVVPGLTFAQFGALAQPAIRGVHATDGSPGSESPIAVYLDGFYLPTQIGGVFELPDTRQIEVLKGPQGTLFGRNATGGAILIHTREPSLSEFSGTITVSDGVYFGENVNTSNDFSINGFINVPVTDKLAISVSGIWRDVQGYMTNDVNGSRYGYVSSYLTRMKVLFQPTDNVRFILAGMYSERSDEAQGTFFPNNGVTAAAHPMWTDAVIPTQPWHSAGEADGGSHIAIINQSLSLTSEFTFPGVGQLTSRTGFAYLDAPQVINVHAAYSPQCVAMFACINYGYDAGPQRTFQQELSFTSETFGMFSFVAGVLYYRDEWGQTQNPNPPALSSDTRRDVDLLGSVYWAHQVIDTKATAGFGEGYLDVTDKLRLIAGIRYSHDVKTGTTDAIFGDFEIPGGRWQAWTPRFSALYKFTPSLNAYATYSKGFKSGSLNSDALLESANPERLTSYEAGVKIGTPDFSFNLSGFFYDYKNLQVQTFDGFRSFNHNAAAVEVAGLDFDGNVQITPEFSLRVAGSWLPYAKYIAYPGGTGYALPVGPFGTTQIVVDASGDRVIKTPRFTGSIIPSYEKETPFGTVDASVTVYYSSSFKWDLVNRVIAPSYVTVATDMGLTLPGDQVRISVWGRNLTNKAFYAGNLLTATADGISFGPPREAGVSVRYSF